MDLNLLKAFDALMRAKRHPRWRQDWHDSASHEPSSSQAAPEIQRSSVRSGPAWDGIHISAWYFWEVSAALSHIQNALTKTENFSPRTTKRTFVARVAEYAEIALVEGIIKSFISSASHADSRLCR
ncbi:hypothetical protein [Paraburkholderia kirstenboschensis]